MSQPGIEPRSPGPLANTLLIRPRKYSNWDMYDCRPYYNTEWELIYSKRILTLLHEERFLYIIFDELL